MASTAVEELATALLLQDGRPVQEQTDEQCAAVTNLLHAFGVDEKDVAGLAMLPGRPLLVIHRVGSTYRHEGRLVCDTEVRAL